MKGLGSHSNGRSRTMGQVDSMNGRRPLRVLVGVQDDGMNGIENYAEQTALAACAAGRGSRRRAWVANIYPIV